jgi:TRAP-type C4-dicarboxylate transport system, small permease component
MFIFKIGDFLEKTILTILVVMTCVLIAVGAAQIFFRYVVDYSLFWSEELMRYLFVWLVMLGIGIGIRQKAHVAVDALASLMGPSAQRIMNIFICLLGLAFFILFIKLGWDFAMKYMGQQSPAMRLPMGYVYLALPLCGLLSSFFYVEQILLFIRNKDKQKKEDPAA